MQPILRPLLTEFVTEEEPVLLEEDDLSSQEALRLISALEKKVANYRDHELAEGHADENPEIALLNIILESIKRLNAVR